MFTFLILYGPWLWLLQKQYVFIHDTLKLIVEKKIERMQQENEEHIYGNTEQDDHIYANQAFG